MVSNVIILRDLGIRWYLCLMIICNVVLILIYIEIVYIVRFFYWLLGFEFECRKDFYFLLIVIIFKVEFFLRLNFFFVICKCMLEFRNYIKEYKFCLYVNFLLKV